MSSRLIPSQHRQFGFERIPKKKRFEYVFKLAWNSTAKIVRIPADDEKEAKKRLDTLIRRTEGGDWLETINLIQIRETA